MQSFWKRAGEDEVERFLGANRPEPRPEFVATVLPRLGTERQGARPQRLGGRVLIAAAVSALALGAGIAAGGVHVAGTGISNLIRVGKSGIYGSNGVHLRNGGSNWGGNYETSVPICHHIHFRKSRWVEVFVPQWTAGNLVKHHGPDYIVGADGNPASCPP
jgi:hypothetical protein